MLQGRIGSQTDRNAPYSKFPHTMLELASYGMDAAIFGKKHLELPEKEKMKR